MTASDHDRRISLVALAILLAALATGVGLRLYAQNENPNVQHDEAWSYASAAGRLHGFLDAMDGGLTDRWVRAERWQYYWQSDRFGDLAQIGPDLSAYDVHPPLYFGLLHLWLEGTGMHKWAGPALNLVFAVLAMLALFGLALELRFTAVQGALAALTWAVSPAVVGISSLTRQYDLVALTTVLVVWALSRALSPRRAQRTWLNAVLVAIAVCAALLTHYQAVLLLAGALVYIVLGGLSRSARASRPPRWPALAGLGAGAVAAAFLAPDWPEAFHRESSKLRAVTAPLFFDKLDAIGEALGRFIAVPGLWLGVAAAAVAVLFVVPRTRRLLVLRIRSAGDGWWTILYFLAVTAGGICLQNLLFLSMPPLLTSRYLAMAWPFAAFLPLLFFSIWPRFRYVLTAAFCLGVLLPATIATPLVVQSADRMPIRQLADADAVLIDNVGVGALPRFLWFVPGGARVFVATQEQLLANRRPWMTADLGDHAYYVAILHDGGTVGRRDQILAELRKTSNVVLLSGNGGAEIYTITPRTSP